VSQDWAQLFVWVQQYLNYSPNTGHTGFANRMWSGANAPSILGEVIVALNVFVKGGCPAGWLQNIKYTKISLSNIHVCFVIILLDILPSQRHSVLQ
jgi:hypothetical protein